MSTEGVDYNFLDYDFLDEAAEPDYEGGPAVDPPAYTPGDGPQAGPDAVGRLLDWHNATRAARGLEPLQLNQQLMDAAIWMSADMAEGRYMSHTSRDGRDPFRRMSDFGYGYAWAGENIAMGQVTVAEVCAAWYNSKGHRDNILNGRFVDAGFSVALDANLRPYWTAGFGSTMMVAGSAGPDDGDFCRIAADGGGAVAYRANPE